MNTKAQTIQVLKPIVVATAFFFALAIWADFVGAQSGRRRLPSSESESVTAPTPEPTPEPSVNREIPPAFTMIVGIDRDLGAFDISPAFYGAALSGCADRLDRSPSVKVQGAERDFSRGEAIKAAKAEKEVHVVWLQLRGDRNGADSSTNGSDLIIEYVVFAPVTAKIVASGRTYQRRVQGGILGIPNTRNIAYREELIREAAETAAERILSSLDLPAGRPIPRLSLGRPAR